MKPRLIQKTFASAQHAPMITVIKNNGTVSQASLLQLLKNLAYPGIHIFYFIIILRPIMLHFCTLWVIRRNGNLFWFMSQTIHRLVERAFMGNGNINNRKKWLPRSPVFITCRIAGLIPNLRLVYGIVVFLGIVGGIIPRIT